MNTVVLRREDLISIKRILQTLCNTYRVLNNNEISNIKENKVIEQLDSSYNGSNGSFLTQVRFSKEQLSYLRKSVEFASEHDLIYSEEEKENYSINSLLHTLTGYLHEFN